MMRGRSEQNLTQTVLPRERGAGPVEALST
jgi:hypothetical protein